MLLQQCAPVVVQASQLLHPTETCTYYCYTFAFKQAEYLALDMPTALREAGFELLEIRSSSPSHIALIARKPE
jgi:hypothetical protein